MQTDETFWSFEKIADTTAEAHHARQSPLLSGNYLGELVADFWRKRLPQIYLRHGPESTTKPDPVDREYVWRLLGDEAKPSAFFDFHCGRYPDWGELALVPHQDYAPGKPIRGVRDTILATLLLTSNDALEWAERRHPQKRRVGPPVKYDWDSFLRQVVLIANTLDGLPDTQSELEKTMQSWCVMNWEGCPSITQIRTKISPLYPLPH